MYFPQLLKYCHYFEIVSAKGTKNTVIRGKLCLSIKILSTAKNTTSNILKYLIGQDSDVKLVEKKTPALTGRPLLPVMHVLQLNNRNWSSE